MPTDFKEPRFASAILTVPATAGLVGMPVATLQSWVGQRHSRPQVVTRRAPLKRGWPSIPLVGLAEAAALRGLVDLGLPRSEIYAVVKHLREHFGSPFPFADERLVTDGRLAYVLEGVDSAYRVATKQHVFVEAVRDYLKPIVFADDHYPTAYRVPDMDGVVIDPRFNAGRWTFERSKVPLFAVAGALQAGEPTVEVAEMYRLDLDEVGLVERHLERVAEAA